MGLSEANLHWRPVWYFRRVRLCGSTSTQRRKMGRTAGDPPSFAVIEKDPLPHATHYVFGTAIDSLPEIWH